MKITKRYLREIIKEELSSIMKEGVTGNPLTTYYYTILVPCPDNPVTGGKSISCPAKGRKYLKADDGRKMVVAAHGHLNDLPQMGMIGAGNAFKDFDPTLDTRNDNLHLVSTVTDASATPFVQEFGGDPREWILVGEYRSEPSSTLRGERPGWAGLTPEKRPYGG